MERAALLALEPEPLLAAVFSVEQPHPELGTAGVALAEQWRAASVPPDALDLCIAVWARALDGLDPGPVPATRLAELDRDLQLQAQGVPVIGRWMRPLRQRIARAEDLDLAIQFLLRARQTWTLTGALRRS